jgi:sigma-B regulation protein RsbU (phosphoserine phosphatase)
MTPIPDPLLRTRLRYNVLLETLSDDEFCDLEGKLIEHRYSADQVIIEDEGYGDEVFFLAEGRIRILKRTQTGEEQLLALLHPGDCFGELELIAGRPRSARVVAVEPCLTYALKKPDFDQLLFRSRPLTLRLMQVLSIRLRALNNHLVFETTRRRELYRQEVQKLEQLIEAAKRLNSTLNLDELLDIILDMALEIVHGDRGTVYVLDEGTNELWTRIARGLDGGRITIRLAVGKGIAGYVAATGDTINIPDAYLDPRFNPEYDRQTGYRTRSILCMPMKTNNGKIIGVFQLLNKQKGEFTDSDVAIINALSIHAALAIENARLVEQERQKIRIERDLLAARDVQMSLLPASPPKIPGYEFAAVALPAREVAGDLYDFIHLGQRRLALTVGDVSGKGLPAALLMAHMQGSVRDVAHETEDVGECVTRLNHRLVESTSPEKFATLVYGVLDTETHCFRYSNAGHNPPMLATGAQPPRLLETGGTLLGIVDGLTFAEESVPLAPGDLLVLYTDGISEAMNIRQEQFGDDRLAALVRDCRSLSASAAKDRILAAVEAHQAGQPAADDITLVVVKRLAGG